MIRILPKMANMKLILRLTKVALALFVASVVPPPRRGHALTPLNEDADEIKRVDSEALIPIGRMAFNAPKSRATLRAPTTFLRRPQKV